MSPSKNALGQSICAARRAAMLTQEQLGKHVGVIGRTVHRWERGHRRPNRRHRQALLTAIGVLAPGAAAALATGLGLEPATPTASPGEATDARQAPNGPNGPAPALELLLLRAADELDLSPRRVRTAVTKLLAELSRAGFTLESAQRELEHWPP
jgi:transcriptional regulator with XRE-family HTH domain